MSASDTSRWFLREPVPGARMRLFGFPYAGGVGSLFRGWVGRLPAWLEINGVQLPGRQQRMAERPYARAESCVSDLVTAIEPLLDLPFVLFGNCSGSILAFETARELERRGLPAPTQLIVSCSPGPQVPNLDAAAYQLDDDALIATLQKLGAAPPLVLATPQLMRLVLPTLRADFELYHRYRYDGVRLSSTPLLVVAGREDDVVSADDLASWSAVVTRAPVHATVPGDHGLLNAPPDALFSLLMRGLHVRRPPSRAALMA